MFLLYVSDASKIKAKLAKLALKIKYRFFYCTRYLLMQLQPRIDERLSMDRKYRTEKQKKIKK